MRCSYCHTEGHNKRTCPELTAVLKRRAAHERQMDDGDSYWARRYEERINPKKRKKTMNCGYCGERGHTRRKCEVIQRDKVAYAKHHNMVVGIVHNYLIGSPIGIGSLFSEKYDIWDEGEYKTKERKLVAVDFRLSNDLLTTNPRPSILLMDPSTGEHSLKPLHRFTSGKGDGSHYRPVKLLCASSAPLPADWLSKNLVTSESLKEHYVFKRTGSKDDDARSWTIGSLERWGNEVNSHDEYLSLNAARHLEPWSEDSIRTNLQAAHAPCR